MKKVLVVLLVVVVAGAALWHVQRDRERQRSSDVQQQQQAGPDYDFEARDVLVRQMDADGRLQYEIEARRFAQSASDGEVVAEGLTIHHDPPGTVPGGPHRWTLTANSAQLPTDGRVISMEGEVRANGLPRGRRTPVRIATGRLSYDLVEQEVSSDADYEISWGGIRATGSGFSYNIDTGNINAGKQKLQSTDASPAP